MNLRTKLNEWVDWDSAAYFLAQSLGMLDEAVYFATDAKHVFWTDNPIGNMLHKILNELVAGQVLERRDDPDIRTDEIQNSRVAGSDWLQNEED